MNQRSLQAFPKASRLRKRREFLPVQEGGSRVMLPSFIVLLGARADDGPARLGITVTRKFGNAVARNRVKRLLREVFRLAPDLFPNGIDFVVIPKAPAARSLDREQVLREWRSAARLIASRSESLRRTLAKNAPAPHTAAQPKPTT